MAGFLLIGGAGFIGSHLTHRLIDDGHDVSVVDDRRRYSEAAIAGHDAVRAWREAHLLRGARVHDVTAGDGGALHDIVAAERPDVVVQLANLPLATVARDDPAHARASIVDATAGVLDAVAAGGGVRRFTYVSSSMVYGDFARDPMPEDGPCRPREAYGRLKLEAERLVRRRARALGLEATVVRPSAVYGPGDAHGRFIQRLAGAARDGHTLVLTGGGLTRLDFTAVADLAAGIAAASTKSAGAGGTFNLSRGEARSLAEAVDIARGCGYNVDVRIEPAADALRPRRGSLDVTRARALLGYDPVTSLEEGLAAHLAGVAGSAAVPA
ncbi:MAG TPA: NAD(P)-dependent oxidoreductase [Solirubrobacteraceae bacterium]